MRIRFISLLAVSALVTVACKGVDQQDKKVDKQKKDQAYYDSVVVNPSSIQPLALFNGERLNSVLTNTLYTDTGQSDTPVDLFTTPANYTIWSDFMPSMANDGNHLFVIQRSGYKYYRSVPWGFQIAAMAQEGADAQFLSSVDMDTARFDIPEEFERPTGSWQLVVNAPYFFEPPNWRPGLYIAKQEDVATKVAIVDFIPDIDMRVQVYGVEDTSKPQLEWTLNIDGAWKGAEQVGNTLYLWSQYTVDNIERLKLQPTMGRYDNWADARAASAARLAQIEATEKDESSTMPSYTLDGITLPLTESCLLPSGTQEKTAYTHLINVTAINLIDKTINSTCLGGESNSFTVTEDAAYVANSYNGADGLNTVIHKFNQGESGLTYAATGSIKGALNRASKLFTTDSDVRAVTSTDSSYQLHILEEKEGSLQAVSTLAADDFEVGGENIRAQFHQDRAFLISDETGIDSVNDQGAIFVIDVEDTASPSFLRKIDVSIYPDVFPINNQYAFTRGFIYGEEEGRIFNDGIGVSLLTLSGENAGLRQSVSIGGGEPEGRDSVVFFKPNDDELRITLPVYVADDQGSYNSGVQMLEVKGLTTDNATISNVGILLFTQDYNRDTSTRPVMNGDVITAFYSGAIWSVTWGKPETTVGPIFNPLKITEAETEEPEPIPEELGSEEPGLEEGQTEPATEEEEPTSET